MRIRTKGLIGLAVFMGFIVGAGIVFLAFIPRLPTGYAAVEKLRQEDLQADAGPITPVPAPAPARAADSQSSRPAPAAQRSETPRQAFERCWRMVQIASRPMTDAELKLKALDKLGPYWNLLVQDSYSLSKEVEFWVQLTPSGGEWSRINPRTTSSSLARTDLLRTLVGKRLEKTSQLGAYFSDVLESTGDGTQNQPDPAVSRWQQMQQQTKQLVRERDLPPLREAAELMHLPTGAVPAIPTDNQRLGTSSDPHKVSLILRHAFLYDLAHDPAFDAGFALRRLAELQHFLALAEYPAESINFGMSPSRQLTTMILHDGPLDSQKLRDLVRVLKPVSEGDAQWAEHSVRKILRFEAGVIRSRALETLDSIVEGKTGPNDNAFHYFYNGTPERLWIKANALNVRRHIDLLAVAMAGGKLESVQAELASLERTLHLVNIRPNMMPIGSSDFYRGRAKNPLYGFAAEGSFPYRPSDALKLALMAWWRDKGSLPESIEELTPDYLPQAAKTDFIAAWIDRSLGKPLLIMVDAITPEQPAGISAEERAALSDPVKYREMAKAMLKKHGQMVTDEQIEDYRVKTLKQVNEEKSPEAKIELSCSLLDFAVPGEPAQGAKQKKQK